MSDTKLVEEILNIIKTDDDVSLKSKIESGISVDVPFPPELDCEPEIMKNGVPLICAASFYGSTKCIRLLVSLGCDKNNADDEGFTASYYASYAGKIEILDLLKELGFEIKGCGQAALKSHNLETFKKLLQLKYINIDDKDFYNTTYLHHAAFDGFVEAAKFLVSETKIDLNAKDRDGRTALHLAAGNGNYEICQILLSQKGRIDTEIKDNYGKLPITYAAIQGEYKIVELFLGGPVNEVQSDGMSPLMRSAAYGKAALTKFLLEIPDINVNLQNDDGMAAIHFAIKEKQVYCAQLLLNDERINPNIQDNEGRTPLHYAAKKKMMEIIKTLLKTKGININIENKAGKTPMQELNELIERPSKQPKD